MALRAPYLMLLPFLALRGRGQIMGVVIGLLAGVAVPMFLHTHIWIDYAAAMRTNSDYYRHGSLPPRPAQAFPAVIEGTPLATMSRMASFPYADTSLYALARRVGFGAPPDLPLLLLFGVLFLAWLFGTRHQSVESRLPGMAAWARRPWPSGMMAS